LSCITNPKYIISYSIRVLHFQRVFYIVNVNELPVGENHETFANLDIASVG
jgi:hypothetical protein